MVPDDHGRGLPPASRQGLCEGPDQSAPFCGRLFGPRQGAVGHPGPGRRRHLLNTGRVSAAISPAPITSTVLSSKRSKIRLANPPTATLAIDTRPSASVVSVRTCLRHVQRPAGTAAFVRGPVAAFARAAADVGLLDLGHDLRLTRAPCCRGWRPPGTSAGRRRARCARARSSKNSGQRGRRWKPGDESAPGRGATVRAAASSWAV